MSEPAALALVPQPDPWAHLKTLVLNSVSSEHTRRSYSHALDAFHAWYRPAEHGRSRRQWQLQ
jgi:hypothetical protein